VREGVEHVDPRDDAAQLPVLDTGRRLCLERAMSRAACSTVASGAIVTGSSVMRSLASAAVALRRRSSKWLSGSRNTSPPNSSK